MATKKDLEQGGYGDRAADLREPLVAAAAKSKDEQAPIIDQDGGALSLVLFSTFIAACGSFEFGATLGFTAPTQDAMTEELKLSPTQYSVFGSILNIGGIIGAITCGRIADSLGRRGAMQFSCLMVLIGWLGIYLALGPILICIGRFFNGLGVGILSYVVPVYIGEITPTKLRGTLSSANQLFIAFGTSLFYVVGALVSWRQLVLAGLIPGIIMFIGLFFIPESPRWLAMMGKNNEFEEALQKLRGETADISPEIAIIEEYLETLRGLPKVKLLDMFDKANIRPLTVAVGLMAFQQFIGVNGVIFYATNIFKSAGFDPSVGTIIYAVLQIVVSVMGASIIDKAGRRPLLMASMFGMLVGSIVVAVSFLLKAQGLAASVVPSLAVTGVLMYIGFYAVGLSGIPWIIMSEVFPLHVKALGGSLVTVTSWFGSWCVSYTFNFLLLWSSYGTFLLDASMCVLGLVFIYRMVPETKGRTLEEIHASMSS